MSSAWPREAAMRWEARRGWLGQSSSMCWHRPEGDVGCAPGEVEHPAKLPYHTRRLRTRDDDNHSWLGGWEIAAQLSG